MTAHDSVGNAIGLERQLEDLARDDPFAYMFAALLAQIEQTAEDAGWDLPPQLLAVERTMLSQEDQAELGADGGIVVTRPLPTPIAELDGEEIAEYLHTIAGRITATPSDVLRNIFGYILIHEGWAITATGEDDPSPTTSPDRIEVRFALGVDATGTAYQVTRLRGVAGPTLVHDGDGQHAVRGSIVEGLRELTLASVAVPGA